jgi:hypothetical protein
MKKLRRRCEVMMLRDAAELVDGCLLGLLGEEVKAL